MRSLCINRPVFIVFEGLDGTGKSKSARDLASKIDAELISTSSPDISNQVKTLSRHCLHYQEICHSLYLNEVEKASIRAQEILSSGRSVVIDRYLLSTTVYAKARGSQFQDQRYFSDLFAPDITVFLSLESSERRRRLEDRACSTLEDVESLNKSFEENVLRGYSELKEHRITGKWLPIDSKVSTEEISAKVIQHIDYRLTTESCNKDGNV